jgi:type IV pilus assembly protein PilV
MSMAREHENGFTLLEVLIAIAILSIGLLGMASLTIGIINGNRSSNEVTTATTLAQEQMERIRRAGYKHMPTTNTSTTENYDEIPGYPQYKRKTETEIDTPCPGMKTVTVTTCWKNHKQVERSVELKTILAR